MTEVMREDSHEPATKADINSLRDGVRGEIHAVRTELSGRLDSHDKHLESIDGNLHRLNVGFARMEGDMTEIKGKVDILLGVKEDLSRFSANVERMTNYFESCVRRMDFQGSMLMEHDSRLVKLEARP